MNLDQLRDELAAKHTRLCSKQILPGSWIDGWNALLKVLSEVAGELPSKQIAQEAIEKYPDCTYRMQGYLAGRREQFDQDRARIGLAEQKYIETVDKYSKAAERVLEAESRLAESEAIVKELAELYRAENEAGQKKIDRCANKLTAAENALRRFGSLKDAIVDGMPDDVIIRCEVTVGDIRSMLAVIL